jgi:hypothetical protein
MWVSKNVLVSREKGGTYHTQHLLLIVHLVIQYRYYTIVSFQLLQQINLALITSHSILIRILETDAF